MRGEAIDALIVGAGPVGLTLAANLVEHGLTCRIIDKAPAPSDKSKALVVWSRTLELLDRLGLAGTFVRAGMKISGASIFGAGTRLAHIGLTSDESPYGFPLMIPQSQTERLLTDHLAANGVPIERTTELVAIDARPDAVSSTLRRADGATESLQTPWLIGCDGAHSTVRHGLGLPFTGHAEPSDWMLADLHAEGPLPRDEISIFWHEQGVLACFPFERDRFRVIADTGPAASSKPPPEPTLADVQRIVDERGPGGCKLSQPVWLANFRINERKVSDYRRGRVMLAGDAAHIHSPAGGQGMNTGMQDAFNLAWKLALAHRGRGQAEPLLSSYSIERSAIGDQVLHSAEKLTTLATLRNPAAQYLRNHVAPLVTSFGFVQDRIRNAMLELSINYRHSPLSAQDWSGGSGGIAAGDRLPDAPLVDATGGGKTTLFAAIRGNRHSLLLLPGASEAQAARQLAALAAEARRAFSDIFSAHFILMGGSALPRPVADSSNIPAWIDPDGHLHRRLGARDRAIIVVRPDGYIGYRGQPAEADKLWAYLDRYLARQSED